MIYSIKRFSALDETRTFSTKGLRLKSKLFGGMRSFYRNQARTVTNPDRFKPGPDNRTQAQKDAILKTNGISTPSALDRGIAGFERGMTSLGTSMGKGVTAVGSVLGKAGNAIGQGASAVGRGIQSGVRTGKVAVGYVSDKAESAASRAYLSGVSALGKTQTAVGKATQSAGQSIMNGVGAVGRGIQSGATSVGQALGKAGTSTGKAIQSTGRGIGRAAQSVGSGISGAFQSVGNIFGGKPKTEVQIAADKRHSDMGRRADVKAMWDVRNRARQNGLKLDVQIAADDRHSEKGRRQRILQQRSDWEREKEAKRQSAASIATKPASTPQQSIAQTATNPVQPAQPKPQVTSGGTQQSQPKPTANPQQPAQQGKVGQWFKNAGQRTWNGVKTAGKIGMIGGTAAAGLGAYALYKTATSDSDD